MLSGTTRLVDVCDPAAAPECFSFCLCALVLGSVRLVLRGRDVSHISQSRLFRLSNRRLSRQVGSKSHLSVMELYFLLSLVFPMLTAFVTTFW